MNINYLLCHVARSFLAALAAVPLGLLGCASDDEASNDASQSDALQSEPRFAGCARGTLEPDLMSTPLAGPAVGDGALISGQYVVSSTYLQIRTDAASQQLFDELVNPVLADLANRPGLMALSLGRSEACGTVRTLAAWQDDAAMIAFVTGPAHLTAMRRVGDVSRGGSVVTHWLGDETAPNWASAARQLAADDGPLY
jgi:hypothetical protein